MRTELLERYRALALPTTRTSTGASPTSRASTRTPGRPTRRPPSPCRRCSTSTSRPPRRSTSRGSRYRACPRRHPLRAAHRRPPAARHARRPDDKFRAHNAAVWEHGLLVHVPAGRRARQAALPPRRERASPGGSLFWRVLVVAEPGSPVHARPGAAPRATSSSSRTSNGVVEVVVARRREGGDREPPAALVEGLALRVVPRAASSATRSSTGSRAASVPRDGKVWIQNDLAGRGATSRVTGAYFADGVAAPRLRHVPAPPGARHDVRLRVQGRAPRHRARPSGAG